MSTNPVGRPPGRNREETIKEILLAARQCFAEKGFVGATIKEVAEMVGKTNRAIYQYYPSKTELYIATLQDAQEAVLPLYLAAMGDKSTLKEKIKGFLLACAEAYRTEPYITGFLGTVAIELSRNAELQALSISEDNPIMAAIIGEIDAAKASGEITSDLPSYDLLVMFVGAAMGIGVFSQGVNAQSMEPAIQGLIAMMDATLFKT